MNATLVWNNMLAYSLQIGLLVAAGAFVPVLARMRAAGARLVYWQLLLAACLLLPWVRPWHREVIVASVSVTTMITSVAAPAPAPHHFHIAPGTLLLYLLAAGAVARLAWLGVGLWRLRRYRLRAWPLEGVCAQAEVLLSADVSSPVTFGWRRPVILLPERFPQLSEPMRQAILCHENLHVARRDWLFTVAEELVRAALWFHPAIWWLLAEIQLAREQAVDARVVAITQSRDPYVDALLEMAGARPELELAPAPLFLRKRHLKQRVLEIVREATMSKTRWISALAASVVFLAGACWLVTGAFPLAAAPQMVSDGAGGPGGGGGFSVVLPPGMRAVPLRFNEVAGLAGLVLPGMHVDLLISSNPPSRDSRQGTATKTLLQNLEVLSAGKDSLKDPQGKAVVAQVITVLVTPAEAEMFDPVPASVQLFLHNSPDKALATAAGNPQASERPDGAVNLVPMSTPTVLRSITVMGLSDQAKADLLARLPYHEGDVLPEDFGAMAKALRQATDAIDTRLRASFLWGFGRADLTIAMADSELRSSVGGGIMRQSAPSTAPETGATVPQRIRVGGNVQAANLISHVEPVYPPLAKQAHVQGTVELSAIIGKDGHTRDPKLVRGHPLLVQAALDAVKDWVYRPTLMNGEPVEVSTQISINFALQPDDNGATPGPIRVGGNVQQANLVTQVAPHYPAEAKQAGLQGTVSLQAIIGKDGTVQDLQVLSGEPVLAAAAMEAVRQWVYRTTLLNGEPVEVQTTIDVNFTLQ